MKHIANKTPVIEVDFLDDKVTVKKLTSGQVMELQPLFNDLDKIEDIAENHKIICTILRMAVQGTEDMTDDDFKEFAIGDLTTLMSKVLVHSGIGAKNEGNV